VIATPDLAVTAEIPFSRRGMAPLFANPIPFSRDVAISAKAVEKFLKKRPPIHPFQLALRCQNEKAGNPWLKAA
jgi:hypothetical protein